MFAFAWIKSRLGSRGSTVVPLRRRIGVPLCVSLLICGCACGLAGCKETDLFTDVIISPLATVEDADNPVVLTVNTPDAEKEDPSKATLDVVKESKTTNDEEMVAVWSKKPTAALSVHHSIFDLDPRLKGIESSDPVRLTYRDSSDSIDEEVESEDEEQRQESKAEAESKKDQKQKKDDSDSSEKDEKADKKNASASKEAGDEATGDEADSGDDSGDDSGSKSGDGAQGAGGGEGGTGGESGDGDGGGDSEGASKVKGGGYGDNTEPVYNPNDRMQEVQHADHVAAMGQAAVIVQAIGGKGALCAMDECTYYGKTADNTKAKTASSFKDVFSDELADGFEDDALLWSGEGASSDDIKDFDALVNAVGANGVILYLGEYGSQSTYFTKQQLEDLEYASIQLVPVDLSTVQGILDAVEVVGEALSESKECAQDSDQMAKDYRDAVKSICKSVINAAGGELASKNSNSKTVANSILTTYNSVPCSQVQFKNVGTLFVDDFETGVSFSDTHKGGYVIDTTQGVAFTRLGYDSSPLSFWAQCAGVIDNSAFDRPLISEGESPGDLEIIWQFYHVLFERAQFKGYSANGPFARLNDWQATYSDSKAMTTLLLWTDRTASNPACGGLGTKYFPYLVTCDNSTATAEQVEDAMECSIETPGSAYYAYDDDAGENVECASDKDWNWKIERVGEELMEGGNRMQSNAFHEGGVKAADVVVANPHGLVSNWTDGTMESVLESVWCAELYSESPANCKYVPITDMSSFSCKVGDATCNNAEETVKAFYRTFYRYDLDDAGYDAVVPERD